MCVCVCAYICVCAPHTRVPLENSCHFHTFIGKLRCSAVICPRDPACVHTQLTNHLTTREAKKTFNFEKGSLLCIHVFFFLCVKLHVLKTSVNPIMEGE